MENSAHALEVNSDTGTPSFAQISSKCPEQFFDIRPSDVRLNRIGKDRPQRLAMLRAQLHSVILRHYVLGDKDCRQGIPTDLDMTGAHQKAMATNGLRFKMTLHSASRITIQAFERKRRSTRQRRHLRLRKNFLRIS